MMNVPDNEYDNEQGHGPDMDDADMDGPMNTLMDTHKDMGPELPVVRSSSIQVPKGGICSNDNGPGDRACCTIF